MQRIGSEKLFPYLTTAANVNESMRILLRERRLDISVVWDQARTAFHASSSAGVENVDAALQLLTDLKLARVLMAQVRQPFSDRNGREGQTHGGRKPPVDEMGVAKKWQKPQHDLPTAKEPGATQAAAT